MHSEKSAISLSLKVLLFPTVGSLGNVLLLPIVGFIIRLRS